MRRITFFLLFIPLVIFYNQTGVFAAENEPIQKSNSWVNPLYEETSFEDSNDVPKYSTQSIKEATTLDGLKSSINESMLNRETTFSIHYTGDTDTLDMNSILYEIINNNEYLDYSIRSWAYAFDGYVNDIIIDFSFGYIETIDQVHAVDQRVSEILSTIITPNMDAHQKVKAVHDYVVLNTEYDTTKVNNSPYPALFEGNTMCNGYAMTMYNMLSKLGINVRLISGYAGDIAHAWNLVELDGKWYHLDATWDDPVPDQPGRVRYDYYLVTAAEIAQDHSWTTGGLNGYEKPYPEATSSYFDALVEKVNAGTEDREAYLDLMEQLDLIYLLPEYTTTTLEELSAKIEEKLSDYKPAFAIRYTNNNQDLVDNIYQLLNRISNEYVVSFDYGYYPYTHGDLPYDQIVEIYNINYYDNSGLGDLNDDSYIDIYDIVLLTNIISGKHQPTYREEHLGDMNNDGFIDYKDLKQMIQILN